MTAEKKPRTTKAKTENKLLDKEVGTETKPKVIGNQKGYIGHLPNYILLKVTDDTGATADLVFSYAEIEAAAQRGKVNVQEGTATLIKDIVKI